MKGEFMSLWDGLLSGTEMNQVTVIGATNRPWDIDPAIQRRLSRQILFALPDKDERVAILKVILRPQTMTADFSLEAIAHLTEHFSGLPIDIAHSNTVGLASLIVCFGVFIGSDLTELCKYACMIPIR
jgi:SpoVK/Ycf46/Vps4 family AAA+-type ATPase